MTSIENITLDVADIEAAATFYSTAFGLDSQLLGFRATQEPSTGFRGYTLSLTVAQPADADAYLDAALAAGATSVKPAAKSMWGYGGVVQAPDGAIWKVATSSKKNSGPAAKRFDSMVLLLGVENIGASKRFYVDHGLPVAKSFGPMYVEFDTGSSPVKLALYKRRALAKDAGVASDGSGSHRLVVGGAATFTDPDGFAWETASQHAAR
ncbi:VOC family protein [Nocardia sp. NPDC046763]|uniref:VOC family protein n=1 Tax=Nocardia sp. NPDC046763 TaxID=3155256 RepID=UPI0033C62CF4